MMKSPYKDLFPLAHWVKLSDSEGVRRPPCKTAHQDWRWKKVKPQKQMNWSRTLKYFTKQRRPGATAQQWQLWTWRGCPGSARWAWWWSPWHSWGLASHIHTVPRQPGLSDNTPRLAAGCGPAGQHLPHLPTDGPNTTWSYGDCWGRHSERFSP